LGSILIDITEERATEASIRLWTEGIAYLRFRKACFMHAPFLVAAFGLFIAVGCSSDAPSEPGGNSDLPDVFVFTQNDQCRAPLRNGASAGDTCILPDDCAEECCSCNASTRFFSAQACVEGKCPNNVSACTHAQQVTAICD
jgi:hypothetical protein